MFRRDPDAADSALAVCWHLNPNPDKPEMTGFGS
jgi:hypothetical protein